MGISDVNVCICIIMCSIMHYINVQYIRSRLDRAAILTYIQIGIYTFLSMSIRIEF